MTSIAALRGSTMFRAFRSPIMEQTAGARRLFASQMKGDGTDKPYPNLAPDEVPDPPGMFATIGAMGAGAGGAVLIAGVGVWAVFKMAFWVAGETGRSLNGDGSTAKEAEKSSEEKIPKAASPLEGRYSWLGEATRAKIEDLDNTNINTAISSKIASPLEAKLGFNGSLQRWREPRSGGNADGRIASKLASFYSFR